MKPIVSIIGVGLLVATAVAMGKKKTETPVEDDSSPDLVSPTPLNMTLILKVGSQGAEVKKLQSFMAITADGYFGPITEAKLLKLKGVKAITLKQFLSSPTINQFILKVGTNVMAKLKNGTPIYKAIAKADTSYYSNYEIVKKIAYGQEVGVIRSVNPVGNWYAIYYSDFPFGKAVGFVKATDIEKF